ncbi:hypothetical protein KY317_02215 [Candidatus Woesearchaeota archaeon]|nr:hypothetical protein [Candidatus Woesearchaeota archaeon]
MKKRSEIIIIALLIIAVALPLVIAGTFTDNSQPDFDNGMYSNTEYDIDHVELSAGHVSGTFVSQVFDANSSAVWNEISWQASTPLIYSSYAVDAQADVWKSTDNGQNWTLIKDDYNDGELNSNAGLIIDVNHYLYAVETDDDIWKSENNGINWTKVNDDYNGESQHAEAVAYFDNYLYIVEGDEDVWVSNDQGITWNKQAIDFNGGNGDIKGFAVDSSGNLYATDNRADVWKSTDNGQNWTLVKDNYNGGETNNNAGLIIDANNYLYAVETDEDVWKSENNGINWTKVNDDYNGESQNARAVAYFNNYLYIVESDEDVWVSNDQGITWNKQTTDFNGGGGDIKGFAGTIENTNLTLSIRNCSYSDCSDSIFSGEYSNSPQMLDFNSRYFQYSFIFETDDSDYSPKLYNAVIDYTVCTENWAVQYADCSLSDQRIKYYEDENSCGTANNLPGDNGTNEFCDYCTYSITNSSWSEWQNQESCQINDTRLQNRTKTEYDANYAVCYSITNLLSDLWNNGNNNTYSDYQSTSCNYCTENITGPFNTSCISNQLTQYYVDINYALCCAVTNLSCDCVLNNGSYDNQTFSCGTAPLPPPSTAGANHRSSEKEPEKPISVVPKQEKTEETIEERPEHLLSEEMPQTISEKESLPKITGAAIRPTSGIKPDSYYAVPALLVVIMLSLVMYIKKSNI